MARLKLQNLTKKFGDKVAVNNLDIEVKDKEFYSLVGPPGAGKTTTFRVIAGFDKPDDGHVYLDDQDVTDFKPGERGVGFFFENLALFPDKTGYENIAFPLEVRKVTEKKVKKRVTEVAQLLRIEHILERLPQTFSGGELQRVALARAIVAPRKIIILDEPLSNVDALLRVKMRAELKKLREELGGTVLYSTHDPIEAMAVSDRICVMNMGEGLQVDAPKEVFKNPTNLFVARFLGSPPMNFIDCSLEESNGRIYLKHEVFQLDVTKFKETISGEIGSEVILGVRPEYTTIIDKPSSKESIETRVYVTEPLGSKTVVDLQLGKENIIKAIGKRGVVYKIGDKKWIDLDLNKIHLINKKTEETIV